MHYIEIKSVEWSHNNIKLLKLHDPVTLHGEETDVLLVSTMGGQTCIFPSKVMPKVLTYQEFPHSQRETTDQNDVIDTFLEWLDRNQ